MISHTTQAEKSRYVWIFRLKSHETDWENFLSSAQHAISIVCTDIFTGEVRVGHEPNIRLLVPAHYAKPYKKF